MVVSLDALSEEMLVSILTQPKNSLVKQYKQLFELDGVDISFEKEALKEIAHEAMERNTGARGLRTIMESSLMDVMYDLPSRSDVVKCVVTKDTIKNKNMPRLLTVGESKKLSAVNE